MALTDNLVSYWKLDESSGNAADAVGSNTLTNNNTATYSAGKINNGVNFNGTDEFLSSGVLYTSLISISTGSFAFWVKPTGTSPSVATAQAGDQIIGDVTQGILVTRANIGGTDRIHVMGYDTAYRSIAITYNADEWTHIAWVHSGGTLYAYKNGTEVSSTALGNTYVDGTSNFNVGAQTTGTKLFEGAVDELGVWSRALTAAEVTSLYNSGSGLQYPFATSTDYPLTAGQGSFTLTGQAAAITSARKLAAAQGTYTLTGQNTGFAIGKVLTAAFGSFTQTLQDVAVTSARTITAAQGAFTLTGQAASFVSAKILSAVTGAYTLAGQVARLLINGGVTTYTMQSKNTASFTNETKNTASFSNETKNSATWINEDKSDESH